MSALQPPEKPVVELPGKGRSISDVAEQLGQLLGARESHFIRGDEVVRIGTDHKLKIVKPVALASDFESVANLVEATSSGHRRTTCSAGVAGQIHAAQAFRDALPPLLVVSRCPVIVERAGCLRIITGYDRENGILAYGDAPPLMPLERAVGLLCKVLAEFRFPTAGDRSRALAALITPALVTGGLLHGRAPIDLGEADSSQTGKGYRNKITAGFYCQSPQPVTTKRSGVGSLEESFDAALMAGHGFISFDNIRGLIDSPAIESFCTEDSYNARAAYRENTDIDPSRVALQFTSNKAEFTKDLANRASCVRIHKQPAGFQFTRFEEGDVLRHVRTNQPLFLGAVFTVVDAWYRAGRPRTDETRHEFREWAQTLDWIVQNLLHAAPLMDGHKEAQMRLSNPAITWLRDVALAVVDHHLEMEPLSATTLLSVLELNGTAAIPGGGDLTSPTGRTAALQQIGRQMQNAFKNSDGETIPIDHLRISRTTTLGANGRKHHTYTFATTGGGEGIRRVSTRRGTSKATTITAA